AVWAMRLVDIPVLREGNIIELMPLGSTKTKKLEVVEACSGIRSLMTLATLAVVFAYFTYPRPKDGDDGETKSFGWLSEWGFWRSVIIVLSAVPIAIFTNALRVSGTGVLSRYYGTEIADGFFHTFSGWALYIVAFILLFVVGWILDRAAGVGRGRGGKGGGSKATSPEAETTDEPAKTPVVVRPTTATISNQTPTGAVRLESAE
ncbi:MAG: archaeosortase/exosortase family protein, partial [Pyrinomonadaceae bacterium]|nr:archaeosortase/exosortase family protein [Pyrinomonadaceae bacterium]